jgi:putative addiction module killer protein
MIVREYRDAKGVSPFGAWFRSLDAAAAIKVDVALRRLELGNTSNVKGVGESVFELKVDFGPGYRIYFGKDGKAIVILLGGGTKKRQQRDIETAQDRWRDYKDRKKGK